MSLSTMNYPREMDFELPHHRVLLVTNVHWDATIDDILEFFAGFIVKDIQFKTDAKSGKKTAAFVMVNSISDAIRAPHELDMDVFFGRCVRVSHVFAGFELDQAGFFYHDASEPATFQVQPAANFANHGSMMYANLAAQGDIQNILLPRDILNWVESAAMFNDIEYPPMPFQPEASFPGAAGFYIPGLQDINLSQQYENLKLSQQHKAFNTPGSPVLSQPQPEYSAQHPRQRVLMITNLHQNVKVNDLRPFFSGHEIIDFKRNHNGKTGKPAPIGFVLFKTIQDRIDAQQKNQGRLLFGRPVKLEQATTVGVWDTGFTKPITPPRKVPSPIFTKPVSPMRKMVPPSPINTTQRTFLTAPAVVVDDHAPQLSPLSLVSPLALPSPTYLYHMSMEAMGTNRIINSPISEEEEEQQQQQQQQQEPSFTFPAPIAEDPAFAFSAPKESPFAFLAQKQPMSVAELPTTPTMRARNWSFSETPFSVCDAPSVASSRCSTCLDDGESTFSSDPDYPYEPKPYPTRICAGTGPWNLAGKDSFDKKYNVVTEAEWIKFGIEVSRVIPFDRF